MSEFDDETTDIQGAIDEQTAELKDGLSQRQQAYRAVFEGPHGDMVKRDLARYCRAFKSTFNPNPHIASKLDGRREVYLRILEHLELSDEELWALYS